MKKLCVDCKWYKRSIIGKKFANCRYVKREERSNIDNKIVKIYQRWHYCDMLRENTILDSIFCYLFETCGPQGRYFEKKRVA